MGTIADKGLYLNQTKQKLKQAINNLGGEITDETTFRNYVNQLENVYDNLPKTEYAEGSNITLENTKKGKLDFDKLEGDIEQDGTPTPTTPIDIKSVTGEQEVVVRGINKCSNSSALEGILINALQSRPAENYMAFADVEEGEKYTISFTKSRVEGETIQNAQLYTYSKIEYYNGNTLISTVNATASDVVSLSSGRSVNKLKVITIPTNCDNIKVYLINNNGDYTYNTKLEKVMILKGEYDSSNLPTYEPYITTITKTIDLGNLELCKIGTYQDYIYKNEGKWYKKSEIKKMTLTGASSEEWTINSNGALFVHLISDNGYQVDFNVAPLMHSNYYVSSVFNEIYSSSKDYGISYGASSTNRFCIRNKDISSVADFKTWLSTHNTEVYYVLATPTDTEITDTSLINQLEELYNMPSNNGTTIIEVVGDLPMILKVRAIKG